MLMTINQCQIRCFGHCTSSIGSNNVPVPARSQQSRTGPETTAWHNWRVLIALNKGRSWREGGNLRIPGGAVAKFRLLSHDNPIKGEEKKEADMGDPKWARFDRQVAPRDGVVWEGPVVRAQ